MVHHCYDCGQPVTPATKLCPRCGIDLIAPPPPGVAPTPQGAASVAGYGFGLGLHRTRAAGYEKAPPGARFAASLLDSAIQMALLLPGFAVVVLGESLGVDRMVGVGIAAMFASFAAALAYGFVKDGWRTGASVGKRAMGLMVVHLPTNQPCTKGQSAIRALIMFVTQVVPFVGWLIEPIMVLAADDGRRFGDRAASTQVVRVAEYASRPI